MHAPNARKDVPLNHKSRKNTQLHRPFHSGTSSERMPASRYPLNLKLASHPIYSHAPTTERLGLKPSRTTIRLALPVSHKTTVVLTYSSASSNGFLYRNDHLPQIFDDSCWCAALGRPSRGRSVLPEVDPLPTFIYLGGISHARIWFKRSDNKLGANVF